MPVYTIIKPASVLLPVVLSIPHAGKFVPEDIRIQLKQDLLPPDDTDWFVDELYNFASSLGITTIKAENSRWVIDLNRNPDDTPLYTDNRIITALCTTTNFMGEPIYTDERKKVTDEEVSLRKELYFTPYHQAMQQLLNEVKTEFGSVLLWDCHSIRRFVPSIQPQPFPDLILGSADGVSASQTIIDTVSNALQSSSYSFSHNHPFKGGYITRQYGKPNLQQHALQLEMAKPLYMNDTEQRFDEQRANNIRKLLIKSIRTAAGCLL